MKKQIVFLLVSFGIYSSIMGQQIETSFRSNPIQDFESHRFHRNSRFMSQDSKATDSYEQKLDSIIEYNYNELTSSWDKKYIKETFAYSDDSRDTSWIYSAWDSESNSWHNLLKESTKYDEQGNVLNFQSFIWENENWKNQEKEEYVYNGKNQLLESLSYVWKNLQKEWRITEKWSYSYNEEEKPLVDSLYWWNDDMEEWKLQEKIEYEYIRGKIHYIYQSSWDSDEAEWSPEEKKWYLYGPEVEQLLSISTSEWKVDDWELVQFQGFSYDVDLVEGYNTAYRNFSDRKWQKILSERYIFDDSVSYKALLLPHYQSVYNDFYFHHKLIEKKLSRRNFDTNSEEQYRTIEYYYSPVEAEPILRTTETQKAEITVYPNPARGQIRIQLPTMNYNGIFEVHTVQGEKVLSKMFTNDDAVNLSFLTSGLYLYRIISEQKEAFGRLIIK